MYSGHSSYYGNYNPSQDPGVTQTGTIDMTDAPSLVHSAMSTRSEDFDVHSRPANSRRMPSQMGDPEQLERQRRYQQQLQEQLQEQEYHDNQQQEQQQQQQQHQRPFFGNQGGGGGEPPHPSYPGSTSSQGRASGFAPPYPPNQPQQYDGSNNRTWMPDDCHLMTPSSGRSMMTEMPSLAYSDGNSTMSRVTNLGQAGLAGQAGQAPPSPSLSPQVEGEEDGDFYLTSVINMIFPPNVQNEPLIDYQAEFTDRRWIAKGGNGEIRRAFWRRNNRTVILKSLIDTKYPQEKIAQMFDKEVEVMKHCREHNNIVQFYGVAFRQGEHGPQRFMVMQFYEHGDLAELLKRSREQAESPTLLDRIYLALDIALGLDHLYKCGYHHGDLHPKNVLIDVRQNCTPQQGKYQARLTDFGLRRRLGNMNAFSSQQLGGVVQFMAPERIPKNRPRYDIRCDIYALGVIYWVLMAGRYPYRDPAAHGMGARENRVEGTPDWYHDVYSQAWSENPNDRQQSYEEIIRVFNYHLGIQLQMHQCQNANATGHPYQAPPVTRGYDGVAFSTPQLYDHQTQQYFGNAGMSAGASQRDYGMASPPSMLTPTSFTGRTASPHPPSPMMSLLTAPRSPSQPSHSIPESRYMGS